MDDTAPRNDVGVTIGHGIPTKPRVCEASTVGKKFPLNSVNSRYDAIACIRSLELRMARRTRVKEVWFYYVVT